MKDNIFSVLAILAGALTVVGIAYCWPLLFIVVILSLILYTRKSLAVYPLGYLVSFSFLTSVIYLVVKSIECLFN